jgi:DNA-binding transcriptional LysR family regulator
MEVNFELYKAFYHVARTLSFSEAAHHLFITQSAVSQSIRVLEEKLGCTLFNRSTKQVKLTHEGAVLFKHVEQAYAFLKSGERSIENIHGLQQGEIRLGASDTICKYYLLPYLQKFNQLYPHIRINITNRTSPLCIEMLKKGVLDFAVVNIPQEKTPQQVQVTKLRALRDVFAASHPFRQLQGRKIDLAALSDYPLLMLESNTITRDFFDRFVTAKGLSLTPEIELGSVDLMIELTKIGLGICFVSREYIEQELASGELFILNITEPIPARALGVMVNTTIPVPIAARKFIELLESKGTK